MKTRHSWSALALATLVACGDAVAPDAESQYGVRRPDTQQPDSLRVPATEASYIVVFRPGVADPDSLTDQLSRTHGGQVSFRYHSVLNGFAGKFPVQALEGIRRNPNVELIEVDAEVQHQVVAMEGWGLPWGLDRIDQRSGQLDGTFSYDRTGAGVTVYLVDSGIRFSHAEFGGRAVFGFDSYGGDGSDCNGHGTHVGGSIGGNTVGVARAVKLVSVRVLSCSASGYVSSIIAGLDWIAAHKSGPSVANLSIGSPAYDPLDRAVRGLTQAGVTVIVAASNYNLDACNYSPARERSAITVGASNALDLKASFSNWGPCVDLFAPGHNILSADFASDSGTTWKNGTSMAAPHVAGAAALFLEGNPGASPSEVEAALRLQSTQGVVALSNSEHNDLLFIGAGATQPPPPVVPPPPPPPVEVGIELTVAGTKEKAKAFLDLGWRGASGSLVRVVLNSAILASSAPNNGSYRYQVEGKGRKTYVFQVCETEGLLRCSSPVSITF